jgi:hypothetical protein
MRSQALLAIATGVVALALAGCSGSTNPDNPSAASPKVTASTESTDGSTASASAVKPTAGTCWRVPPASTTDPDYWFDGSPQVPCTKPHTTESAAAITLTEPTIAEAQNRAGECFEHVRVYVGVDPSSWVPWHIFGFLPSKKEIADGASWLRCDVAFPAVWGSTRARTVAVAAEGLALKPPADFWACLDKPPTRQEQPFVSCQRPHAYEETGTLALLEDLQRYPSSATLRAEGRRQCRAGVPPGHPQVAVVASWDPPAALQGSSVLAGPCFMFDPKGQSLPPR